LPVVKVYAPGAVHYAGEVVAFAGATFQALKDTGKAPDVAADWICLAAAGRDGLIPKVRGTYRAGADYHALDIVALNGGSFVARADAPGECPGDGWQSLTMPGKRGDPGSPGAKGAKGDQGPKGEPGNPAPAIVGWRVDRDAYALHAVLSDGSESAPCEVRGLFEQFHSEAAT
jgi:hypothetical protein